MPRYHINPQTGNPGVCRAAKQCPFGDLELDHYDSPNQARQGYEKQQKEFYLDVVDYPHSLKLSPTVEKLLTTLEDLSLIPLLVGGSVRDSLGKDVESKDIDIEVFGRTSVEKIAKLLTKKGYKLKEVGVAFGVIKTKLEDGTKIDISLPRTDSKVGVGHRGFRVNINPDMSLREASARRDLTINSLYYTHSGQKILDAHGGMEDWKNGVIRHTSDAFSEDPLRVLRVMQFSSRMGFDVASETIDQSRSISDKFNEMPDSRIQEEWEKMYRRGEDITRGLTFLSQSGWGEHFGITSTNVGEVANHAEKVRAEALSHNLDPTIYGAYGIAQSIDSRAREIFLQKTLVGDRKRNQVNALLSAPSPTATTRKEINRWARELSRRGITPSEWLVSRRSFISDSELDEISRQARDSNVLMGGHPDLIRARDVMALTSKEPGPWLGELLRSAGEAQDDELFTDATSANNWLVGEINS